MIPRFVLRWGSRNISSGDLKRRSEGLQEWLGQLLQGRPMAKQDEFVRITLRLPPDLHEKLAAAAGSRSMNAEIVARIQHSFAENERVTQYEQRLLESEANLIGIVKDLIASRKKLESQTNQLASLAEAYLARADKAERELQQARDRY
jgi:hypothetical protein